MTDNSNTNILAEFRVLFKAGEYEKAEQVLLKQKDLFDAGVFEYNLGITNYKQGKLVEARIYLEKALAEGFYSKEVSSALKEVKSELGVISLEKTDSKLNEFKMFSYQAPRELYFSITILLTILLVVFRKNITSKVVRTLLLIVTLLPTVFYFEEVSIKNIEVSKNEHLVFAGPSKMFEQVQLIPAGMKLITGKTVPGWKFVELPESHRGWIEDSNLEKL